MPHKEFRGRGEEPALGGVVYQTAVDDELGTGRFTGQELFCWNFSDVELVINSGAGCNQAMNAGTT